VDAEVGEPQGLSECQLYSDRPASTSWLRRFDDVCHELRRGTMCRQATPSLRTCRATTELALPGDYVAGPRIEFYSRAVLLVIASRGMPWRRGGRLQHHMPNSAVGSDRSDVARSSGMRRMAELIPPNRNAGRLCGSIRRDERCHRFPSQRAGAVATGKSHDELMTQEPLKIGLLAPPWAATPPPGYGGTESVVCHLAQGLSLRSLVHLMSGVAWLTMART
jgi:hypothetical protein